MAITTVEGKLKNGSSIKFDTFKSRQGFPIKARLLDLIGTPLVSLVGKISKDTEGEMVLDGSVLQGLVQALTGRLSEKGIDLIFDMIKDVEIDGEIVDVDEYYSASYDLMYEVALKVIQGNYGSLLSLVGISPTQVSPDKLKELLSSK